MERIRVVATLSYDFPSVFCQLSWSLIRHFFSPVDDRDLRVRVGTSIGEMGGEVYNVTSVIFHEKYDDKALMDTGDVGLILLDRALAYSDSVQPINLIKRSAMPGQMAYVTGYGSQDIQIIPPINKRSKLLNRVKGTPNVAHSHVHVL